MGRVNWLVKFYNVVSAHLRGDVEAGIRIGQITDARHFLHLWDAGIFGLSLDVQFEVDDAFPAGRRPVVDGSGQVVGGGGHGGRDPHHGRR